MRPKQQPKITALPTKKWRKKCVTLKASLYTGRLRKILMVVFKSLFVSTYPGYLKELFVFRNSSYSLRGKNILTLPIPRTTNYGLESIRYQAAKIWNSLPDSMRAMTSFKDFKKAIKEMNF